MSDLLFWMFWTTVVITIVWAVLMAVWMHALDDAGEPWWAVYVPGYSLVCCLRAVDMSPHNAWWIIPTTLLGLFYLGGGPAIFFPPEVAQSTLPGPHMSSAEGLGRGAVEMFFILAAPVWLNVKLYRKVNA